MRGRCLAGLGRHGEFEEQGQIRSRLDGGAAAARSARGGGDHNPRVVAEAFPLKRLLQVEASRAGPAAGWL